MVETNSNPSKQKNLNQDCRLFHFETADHWHKDTGVLDQFTETATFLAP